MYLSSRTIRILGALFCIIVLAAGGAFFWMRIQHSQENAADVFVAKPEANCEDVLGGAPLTLSATERDDVLRKSIPLEPDAEGLYTPSSKDIFLSWDFRSAERSNDYFRCTYHGAWVLLQSRSPNPEYDPEKVYWHRTLGKYPWSEVIVDSPGIWYFRACYGSYDPVGCELYSNTIKVSLP